ncbi:MAG: SDR family oxidoreductase [Gallionella sp.]
MTTALVTGANGFVGQAMCTELRGRGWNVKAALRSHGEMDSTITQVMIGPINADTKWGEALAGVDVIIHLAARVHVMNDSAPDPLAEFLNVNLHGTANLATQAAQAGIKRLVYVSSIKVNGEETDGTRVYSERDTPAPQDPYAVSKWKAEQALHKISRETGLEVVIIRPPLVYGPGVKGNFIRLLAAVRKGMPLPLAGARNTRSLVYVGNLVSALIACAANSAAAGQTYLVSDGQDVSTADLVRKIATALECDSRLFYFPLALLRGAARLSGRSGQLTRLFGSLRINNTKLHTELGWTPPYTMERGLRHTADWYCRSAGQ